MPAAARAPDTRLARAIARVDALPELVRTWARSFAIGRVIPFVGTAGLRVERLDHERCVIVLANRRRVRNHIGGVHATATALLAETATGMVVGMNLPDAKLPLLKSMSIRYQKRAEGAVRAEAWLPEPDVERMQRDDKGDVVVPVVVTDAAGTVTVECEMCWAWITKGARA
jgi:acyl-coenzyme A thioesterase PaaI-like protein